MIAQMSDPFGGHTLTLPYKTVAELLADYRARHPDKTAIVDIDQGSSITYGELEQLVTDIAADLKRRGVAKGDRVVLLSDEVLEKLLIWLGVWRLGAVVCPLNIELNSEHVSGLTATIAPKLILVHKDLDVAALTAGAQAPVVRFGEPGHDEQNPDTGDEFFTTLRRHADPNQLPERNEPADMSCIFCTSGTAGRPKLVVYDNTSYWLVGLSTLECLGLTPGDKTLEYRSFGWNSAQVLSLMPFLQLGLTMHIARRFSNSRFFDWIRQYGITFAAGVPTVINILLNKQADDASIRVPSLRMMSCSSAPLSPEQWVRFERMYGVMLLQMYGMSEAGWICGNRHYKRRMGTVGLPALHQEFDIVDGEGKSCPPGVEGEITCGGPQCSIGLLREDGTIDPVRGARVKSGDLATRDEDGFVRITGRAKDLIIRGGANISPVEVDGVLLACPGVIDAASVGVPDPIYGEEVVAFAVLKPDQDAGGVLAYCAAKLPLPKRPKQLFVVGELPKSDRGKVLRDRLREQWAERTKA
jgi:acyl-coenzyme A synthetase/AMP-(fatty) acid ligase